MYVEKSAEIIFRKLWCFFFIYSSIKFNIECGEREQNELYVFGEKKKTKFYVTIVWDSLRCFQTERFFQGNLPRPENQDLLHCLLILLGK